MTSEVAPQTTFAARGPADVLLATTRHAATAMINGKVSGPPWAPLLAGELGMHALDAVAAVAADLRRAVCRRRSSDSLLDDDASLVRGDAGIALLFAYCAATDLDVAGAKYAEALFLRVSDALVSGPRNFGFLSGAAGMAWSIEHLRHLLFPDADDPLLDVDTALLEVIVERDDWKFETDIFDGLVGIGVYALERPHSEIAQECISAVVRRLAEVAEHDARGVFWTRLPETLQLPDPSLMPNRPYVDLGMARGIPSVIAFLGRAASADGHAALRARELLLDAVPWLLAQHREQHAASCFSIAAVPGQDYGAAQTAWCYGDPGIAAALLVAHGGAPEQGWDASARHIVDAICSRPLAASTVDAGICHGAAGVAHILNRAYHALGSDQHAKAAATRWFQHALGMRRKGCGVGGFLFRWAGESRPIPGVLRGAAGVALALIAAATDCEPAWDRMLLLS